jgi:glycosyltransferase involved in cell wall biosynthesis
MHLLTAAILLSWMIALAWTVPTLIALSNLPRVPNLLEMPLPDAGFETGESGSAFRPELTVIVPARNEAQSIEQTLQSLLGQTLPVEIIAVDDRSEDETGAIMERVAAEGQAKGKPLRVVHVETLPAGWMGKTHAMALAARQATTPWLLFTDGDVLYDRDTIRRSMDYAAREQADHVVLMPTLILKTVGERMMISLFQTLSLLSWRPWKIADPKAKSDSIGVGAFNLMRSEVYRAVGGFEAQKMEVLEDLRLGFEIKRNGYRQRMVFGRGLIQVHWAPGALGIVRNLTKNIFAVFRFRPLVVFGVCAGLGLMCFGPIAALFGPLTMKAAGVVSLAMFWLLYRDSGRRQTGVSPMYLLTLPVAAMLMVYSILRSMVVTLMQGGVIWRGTFYPLDELKKHAGPLR